MGYICLYILTGGLCWLFWKFILRVEQFWKPDTSFAILNSKLSVTVYIYYDETVIYLNNQIYRQLIVWKQISLCNLNFVYVLISKLLRHNILYLYYHRWANY